MQWFAGIDEDAAASCGHEVEATEDAAPLPMPTGDAEPALAVEPSDPLSSGGDISNQEIVSGQHSTEVSPATF